MTYDIKQQAKEQGFVLDERCTLTTNDLKHIVNYDGESHGDLIRVLEDFYEDRHREVYDAIVEQFEFYLDGKNN